MENIKFIYQSLNKAHNVMLNIFTNLFLFFQNAKMFFFKKQHFLNFFKTVLRLVSAI